MRAVMKFCHRQARPAMSCASDGLFSATKLHCTCLIKSKPENDGFEQVPACARDFVEKTPQTSVFAAQRPVRARHAGGGAANGQTLPCNPKSVKHSCLLSGSRSASAATSPFDL